MPGNIVAYDWSLNGTSHIAYETGDNHIHEMVAGQKGTWNDNDITRIAGGPELEDAMLAAYAWEAGKTKQVVYVSGDGHVHEFAKHVVFLDTAENPHIHSLMLKHGGQWQHTDVTDETGAPPIV